MNERRHFHTFDALRFFAFFKVFLLHIPILSFPDFNYFKKGGGIGVLFFFVLSGFLITYILLTEKHSTGTVNLRRFFLRRILRIWPLYFLMIGIAFMTPYMLSWLQLPHSDEGYTPNWLMSFAFLENYQMMITRDHPNVSPLGVTWSLCVEEHFYIIWGILLYATATKKLPFVFGACVVIAMVCRYLYASFHLPKNDILTNIDYFAYGAIPAYLLVTQKKRFDAWLSGFSRPVKLLALSGVLIYVILSPNINYPLQRMMEPLVFGILFIITICCILPEKNAIVIPDRNVLSRLGLYTYGMYLYHTIVINFLFQLFKKLDISTDTVINTIAFTLTSFALTVVISMLSYHYFEKYFLLLKGRIVKDRKVAAEATSAFAPSETGS